MIRRFNEAAAPGRRCGAVATTAWMLLGTLFLQCFVRAGSIFDDNWTPPAPAKPAITPPDAHETRPGPEPVTPDTAKLETTKPQPGKPDLSPKAPAIAAPVPSTGAPPARRAIPDPAAQAKSRKLFKGIYAKELADHSAAARRELAAKLLAQAASVSDAPTDEFVLLAAATDAGKEGSDLGVLCKAADAMADAFDVDGLRLKIDRAMKMTLRADSPDVAADNCRAGLKLVDQLVADEDYLTAGRILQLLHTAAPDAKLRSEISARIKGVDTLRTEAAHVVLQLQKLKASPDDPVANLAVGKYYCFVKDDWNAGLPLLAKSGDVTLKSIAQQELSAPSDALAKMGLADKWAALASKTQGTPQTRMQRRAVKWYDEALPSLTGLEKVAAERKRRPIVADISGMNGHKMTAEEIAARFTFPNKTFHISGEAITGEAGNCQDGSTYVWLAHAETMESFVFGLDIKSKWSQMASVSIDGLNYTFSCGHYGNSKSAIFAPGKIIIIPGNIKNPDDWAAIKLSVEESKMTVSYNGAVVGGCDLVKPITKSSTVKVGFTSDGTQISVKNVYILER